MECAELLLVEYSEIAEIRKIKISTKTDTKTKIFFSRYFSQDQDTGSQDVRLQDQERDQDIRAQDQNQDTKNAP